MSRPSKYAVLPPPTGIQPATEETKAAVSEQRTVRRVRDFYPIHDDANFPFSRMQVDLMDLVDVDPTRGSHNSGYKYIYLAVDVFSRYLIGVPLKTKGTEPCTDALRTLLDTTLKLTNQTPNRLQSDKEKAFMSHDYRELAEEQFVELDYRVDATDHRFLAYIDRAVRTVREILQQYINTYDTQNWVDVLPRLLATYNSTIHSGTGLTPDAAIHATAPNAKQRDQRRIKKQRANRLPYNQVQYKVGDQVRYRLDLDRFEKRSHAQFSRDVHTITDIVGNSYFYISGKDRPYRKDQLILARARHGAPVTDSVIPRQQAQRRQRRSAEELNRDVGVNSNQQLLSVPDSSGPATRAQLRAQRELLH